MAAVTGLTMIKKFTYRGDSSEEFSNTYHFKGPPPGDDPSWHQLSGDVWARESKIFTPVVSLVRIYGYDSDDPNAHHVWVRDLEALGEVATGVGNFTGNHFAGDQAACVWWKTARLNKRGKPIYLRKYVHSGFVNAGLTDDLETAYKNALDLFAGTGQDGIQSVHGGLRSLHSDENVQASGVIPYVTTRTLKRRGKRPTTGS